MNQLEHLKALRDKARVQTEQAKAVLKQQGEITESLDRLISALEGEDDDRSVVESTAATSENFQSDSAGSLGKMIANLDSRDENEGPEIAGVNREEIIWENEEPHTIPPSGPTALAKAPPKLEPIVWEVSDSPLGGEVESVAEEEPPVENVEPVPTESDDEEEDEGVKFKFLKFSDEPEEPTAEAEPEVVAIEEPVPEPELSIGDDSVSDETVAIAPPQPIEAEPISPPEVSEAVEEPEVVDYVNEVSETTLDTVDETMAIDPAMAAGVGSLAVRINESETEDVVVSESPVIEEVEEIAGHHEEDHSDMVSSNIFFDANSAYLKDSELMKIQSIAEAVSGAEARMVKIQGLEDLASSNDFKVLLASRRVLAVKKKLAEKGIGVDQLEINEIRLSEEGRVLEPPSITIATQPV